MTRTLLLLFALAGCNGHSKWYNETMPQLKEQNRLLDSMLDVRDRQRPYKDSAHYCLMTGMDYTNKSLDETILFMKTRDTKYHWRGVRYGDSAFKYYAMAKQFSLKADAIK